MSKMKSCFFRLLPSFMSKNNVYVPVCIRVCFDVCVCFDSVVFSSVVLDHVTAFSSIVS